MNKKIRTTKLALSKESLRALSSDELGEAAGGTLTINTTILTLTKKPSIVIPCVPPIVGTQSAKSFCCQLP